MNNDDGRKEREQQPEGKEVKLLERIIWNGKWKQKDG